MRKLPKVFLNYINKMKCKIAIIFCVISLQSFATRILLPMDDAQKNHLKAYGLAYWVLQKEMDVDWLLNYRAGSFMLPYSEAFERECKIRSITFEVISEGQVTGDTYRNSQA
jgi:uncharacterized protein YueI